jgi:hypothetical protein
MSFHVGQQVVCINDRFSRREVWRRAVRIYPQLNSIYTIREIFHAGGLTGFCFYEFSNPPALFDGRYLEPAFNSRNFRPVKKTSIEVLERLLAPVGPVTAGNPSERKRETVPT